MLWEKIKTKNVSKLLKTLTNFTFMRKRKSSISLMLWTLWSFWAITVKKNILSGQKLFRIFMTEPDTVKINSKSLRRKTLIYKSFSFRMATTPKCWESEWVKALNIITMDLWTGLTTIKKRKNGSLLNLMLNTIDLMNLKILERTNKWHDL